MLRGRRRIQRQDRRTARGARGRRSALTVIRRTQNTGGAAPSFYDLLLRAPVADDTFVAFADQDDIWRPGKLARHAAILAGGEMDAVSSNVLAFGDGEEHLIRQGLPQRRFDYLFEGPGPGCTHLMSPRLVRLVRGELEREGFARARRRLPRLAGLRGLPRCRTAVAHRPGADRRVPPARRQRVRRERRHPLRRLPARPHEAAVAPGTGGNAHRGLPPPPRDPRIAPTSSRLRSARWLTLRSAHGSRSPRNGVGSVAGAGTRWPWRC